MLPVRGLCSKLLFFCRLTSSLSVVMTQRSSEVESIIKSQRRIKGSIVMLDLTGLSRITSPFGDFPFVAHSVKENKKYPGRPPKLGDKCEFKLSDTNPVKATSIRIMIPRGECAVERAANDSREVREASDEGMSSVALSSSSVGSPPGCSHATSTADRAMTPLVAAVCQNREECDSACGNLLCNCFAATSSLMNGHGNVADSATGLEDLCRALQSRGGTSSGSLFSIHSSLNL